MPSALNLIANAAGQSQPQILYGVVSSQMPAPSSPTDPMYVELPQWQPGYYFTITDWGMIHGTSLPQQGAEVMLAYDSANALRCPWWDGVYAAPPTPVAPPAFPLTPTAVKTGAYTASAQDLVLGDVSGGGFTAKLPNAPATGTMVGVKIVNVASAAINALKVKTQGSDVIDVSGTTTQSMYCLQQYCAFGYTSLSATWTLLANEAVQPSPWVTVTVGGNWTVVEPVGYCIDAWGVVRLRGALTASGVTSNNTTLFTLPFAPTQAARFYQEGTGSGATYVPFQIDTSGVCTNTVTVSGGVPSPGLAFEGLSFTTN